MSLSWIAPQKAVEMLTNVLDGTEYVLKKGNGFANRTYDTTSTHRIFSIGQGSGNTPNIWTSILDTIIYLVSEKYESFVIETSTKQIINCAWETHM